MGVVTSIIFFLISFLPGCIRKSTVHYNAPEHSVSQQVLHEPAVCEQEARLVDIPLPLPIFRLPSFVNSYCHTESTYMLGYSTTLSLESLIHFYEQEMEQEGWQKQLIIRGKETLLLFQKPTRYAIISLRETEEPNKEIYIIIAVSPIESSAHNTK